MAIIFLNGVGRGVGYIRYTILLRGTQENISLSITYKTQPKGFVLYVILRDIFSCIPLSIIV